jgi:acyl phosphate:glycerol-3-phosphate acyltransferase
MHPILVVVVAFVVGAIPFSNIAARRSHGVDLRDTPTGTVSGTALYHLAGFRVLALAGVLDVAKGAVGPWLAGPARPGLVALAAGAAIAGHNWSPFLRGSGGRGFAPALGALLVAAWVGALLLLASLLIGLGTRQTGLAMFVAIVLLAPVLAITDGSAGALVGLAVAVPMLTKRLLGNRPPTEPRARTMGNRLLFDRDEWPWS